MEEHKDLLKLIKDLNKDVKLFRSGDYVEGKVVGIDNRYVIVDIGSKSEGIVPIEELKSYKAGGKDVQVGDTLFATVIQSENRQGNLVLSLKKSEVEHTWTTLSSIYNSGDILDVKVIDYLKGGLLVDVNGQRGFIPISHLDREHFEQFNQAMAEGTDSSKAENLGGLKNQTLKVKIIEINPEKNRLILSEKEVLGADEVIEREKKLATIHVGDIIECTVSTILPYGVLVDLGGVDGLIHISEIAWEKVESPGAYFKNGDKIKAKVISKEDDKIALSYKELKDNPWNNVEEKYPVGKVITAKVSKVVPFGVFIELEPGLDGLIHISETLGPLSVGDEVKAIVVKADSKERKLALSIRQLEDAKIYK